jgi:protein tyrosine/serine phosphatase
LVSILNPCRYENLTVYEQALQSFLDLASLPILIHCTQGKDRTGIVVVLLLMILGVPEQAIEFDYQLSDEELLPEKESRLVEIREIGLTDDFGDTAKDFVQNISAHLEAHYGGLEGYLDGIGFDKRKRQQLIDILGQ